MAAEMAAPLSALKAAAQNAETEGRADVAVGCWQEARRRFCTPEVYLESGACLRRLDRLDDAADVLFEGLRLFPGDQWIAVDLAWAAFEQGKFAACETICANLRRRFPDNLGAFLAGALSCRRERKFAEAEAIYAEALERFPDNAQLLGNYAVCAEEQNDDVEAARRWRLMCERFPDSTEGPVRLAAHLSKMGQFDEADERVAAAIARLPGREDLLTAYAWVAHDRQDWPAALRRWEAVINQGQNSRQARHLAAVVLDTLGRHGEAAQVLGPALRLFPDDQELVVFNAWLATRRRDVEEAKRLWQDIRARFPLVIDSYHGEAAALADSGRMDAADALLIEGLARFPNDFTLASGHARMAERRNEWALAATRWRTVLEKWPDEVEAHVSLVNGLARSAQPKEALACCTHARERFPNEFAVAAAEAHVVARLEGGARAIEVWTRIQSRFPGDPRAAAGLGFTLREAGQLEQAEQSLEAAAQRFPGSPEIEAQWALTLSARRQWPKALALWSSLKERFPNHPDVKWGIRHTIDQAALDVAAGLQDAFQIPEILRQGTGDDSATGKELALLLNRFESLGDSCEFAIVQRLYGVNNLSLLRWTSTPTDKLIAALNDDLAGVGDPQYTVVSILDDEYVTEDTRYYMHSHTFTHPSAEPLETFAPEQCRRIRWLRNRFIADLKSAARVLVYSCRHGISGPEALELHDALRRYHPHVALMCVRLQTADHPSGSVERIRQGLFVGYLDRFSTIDVPVDAWIGLCRQVTSQLTTEVLPADAAS